MAYYHGQSKDLSTGHALTPVIDILNLDNIRQRVHACSIAD